METFILVNNSKGKTQGVQEENFLKKFPNKFAKYRATSSNYLENERMREKARSQTSQYKERKHREYLRRKQIKKLIYLLENNGKSKLKKYNRSQKPLNLFQQIRQNLHISTFGSNLKNWVPLPHMSKIFTKGEKLIKEVQEYWKRKGQTPLDCLARKENYAVLAGVEQADGWKTAMLDFDGGGFTHIPWNKNKCYVSTNSGIHLNFFYKKNDLGKCLKIALIDEYGLPYRVGDVKVGWEDDNKPDYVVGPGSIHPTGTPYLFRGRIKSDFYFGKFEQLSKLEKELQIENYSKPIIIKQSEIIKANKKRVQLAQDKLKELLGTEKATNIINKIEEEKAKNKEIKKQQKLEFKNNSEKENKPISKFVPLLPAGNIKDFELTNFSFKSLILRNKQNANLVLCQTKQQERVKFILNNQQHEGIAEKLKQSSLGTFLPLVLLAGATCWFFKKLFNKTERERERERANFGKNCEELKKYESKK